MATRERPWPIFLGAAGAFFVQSLVAVSFGSLFMLLPARWVHLAAGALFLVFAVMLWNEKEEAGAREISRDQSRKHKRSFWGIAASAFVTIFIAEWGDLTQLATAAMAAHERAPVTIFISATLALWCVTGLGVVLGHGLQQRIPPQLLQKIGALVFAAVGLWLLVSPFV